MDDPFVQIAAFSQPLEAHLAKTKLEANDFEVQIQDEHLIGANWLYSQAVGGVKLFVRESEQERAMAVLAEGEVLDSEGSCATDEGRQEACPRCGSGNVVIGKDRGWTVWSWLLLGVPLFPPAKRSRCSQCGNRWTAK